MIRSGLICALSCLMLVVIGCAKSDDPRPQANAPIDGLMPSGGAVYDGTYLADQTQVEMLPARTIPEGSLLDDAVAVASAPEAPARVAQEGRTPVGAGAPAAGGGGSFWQRVGMKAVAASMSGPRPVETPSGSDVDDEGEDGEEDEDEEDEDDEEEDDEDEEEDED